LAARLCPDPLRGSKRSPRPPSWLQGAGPPRKGKGEGEEWREKENQGMRKGGMERREGRVGRKDGHLQAPMNDTLA